MNTAALLGLLLQYGPSVAAYAVKLHGDVVAGRGDQPVSPADLAELQRLAAQSSGDIYARLGITPPPAK